MKDNYTTLIQQKEQKKVVMHFTNLKQVEKECSTPGRYLYKKHLKLTKQ